MFFILSVEGFHFADAVFTVDAVTECGISIFLGQQQIAVRDFIAGDVPDQENIAGFEAVRQDIGFPRCTAKTPFEDFPLCENTRSSKIKSHFAPGSADSIMGMVCTPAGIFDFLCVFARAMLRALELR